MRSNCFLINRCTNTKVPNYHQPSLSHPYREMSLICLSSKTQPLIQRAVYSQGIRSMGVLSKQSGEEYKKMVGWLDRCILGGLCFQAEPSLLMRHLCSQKLRLSCGI